MIIINDLKKAGFQVKKKRKRTLDTNFQILDIIAFFKDKSGSYSINFAYDGEKLYKIKTDIEEKKTKWGLKTILNYKTNEKITINTIEELKEYFISSYNIVPFAFEK